MAHQKKTTLARIAGALVLLAALSLSLASFKSSQRKDDDPWDRSAADKAQPKKKSEPEKPRAAASRPAPSSAESSQTAAAAAAPGVPVALGSAPPAEPSGESGKPSTPASGPSVGAAPLIGVGEGFSNLTRISAETPSYWSVISKEGDALVYVVRGETRGTDIVLKRNFTGQAVTRLTSHPAVDKQPALSPDGSQVAFSSNRAGNYDIFILSTRGGMARRQVTSGRGDEEMPDWSPDGGRIAYSAQSPVDGKWYIWVKDLRNGAQTQYVEGLYPRFSPDGRRILFQRTGIAQGARFALWTMDLDGNQLTQVVEHPDWGATQPRWSPDGKSIIFAAVTGEAASAYTVQKAKGEGFRRVVLRGGTNLWTVRSDGSSLTQLTSHTADDWYPFWAAGGAIYFTTTRGGAMRIWRFSTSLRDAPSAGARRTLREPAPVRDPGPGPTAPEPSTAPRESRPETL